MPSTPSNFIPRGDGDFNAWQQNFAQQAADFLINNIISDELAIRLLTAQIAWNNAYPKHVAAQAAAEAATETKNQARIAFEKVAREAARAIQAYPATTDADRASMGITVAKTLRTPTDTPRTRPVARVDLAQRLKHTLRFSDESTPTRKAKPAGAIGAEIRLTLVNPGQPTPTNPDALSYLTLATDGEAEAVFKSEDGGKTAVYMLRWVAPGGVVGPWSDVVTGTVAA
ncbi:MAG TPA: hypothetical protein VF777_08875 [Phycisphaerales bacterium]